MKLYVSLWAAVLLLFAVGVNGEPDDFKKDFGDRFAIAIKSNGLTMFQKVISNTKDFYEKLVRDFTPTLKEVEDLKQKSHRLDKLSENIKTMEIDGLLRATRRFVKHHYVGTVSFSEETYVEYDPELFPLIKQEIKKYDDDYEKFWEQFVQDTANVWSEMFQTIPKVELERHTEYERIEELMQNIEKSHTLDVDEAFNLVVEFFDYDWYELVELIGKYSSDEYSDTE